MWQGSGRTALFCAWAPPWNPGYKPDPARTIWALPVVWNTIELTGIMLGITPDIVPCSLSLLWRQTCSSCGPGSSESCVNILPCPHLCWEPCMCCHLWFVLDLVFGFMFTTGWIETRRERVLPLGWGYSGISWSLWKGSLWLQWVDTGMWSKEETRRECWEVACCLLIMNQDSVSQPLSDGLGRLGNRVRELKLWNEH